MKPVIKGKNITISPLAEIGENVTIEGEVIIIEDYVVIQKNTTVSARNIHIGYGTLLEENCKLFLSGETSEIYLGDFCFIGHDSKIVVPVFKTGDYVKLNNHFFSNGLQPCTIGHNVWIGQNCILNSYDKLSVGNGVGIGTYSSIWTHGGHGELLEGCSVFKVAPVVLEDDVWILGSYNVISPGVTVGRKSVILTGSVVTKDVKPNSTVAGNPARDITEKISFYQDISLEGKYKMMKAFIKEFMETNYRGKAIRISNGWQITINGETSEVLFLAKVKDQDTNKKRPQIIFTKKNLLKKEYSNVTIFDLVTKKYTKRRTELEVHIIKSLLYAKARFLPLK